MYVNEFRIKLICLIKHWIEVKSQAQLPRQGAAWLKENFFLRHRPKRNFALFRDMTVYVNIFDYVLTTLLYSRVVRHLWGFFIYQNAPFSTYASICEITFVICHFIFHSVASSSSSLSPFFIFCLSHLRLPHGSSSSSTTHYNHDSTY